MKKHCIGCKRELSPGLQECPICGAPQSYLRYYRKSVILLLLLVGGAAWAANWQLEKSAEKARIIMANEVEAKTNDAQNKISELETLLEQTNKELTTANQKIADIETQQTASSSQASNQLAEFKQKMEQAEKRAKTQQDRAGWLSRENNRLKGEIKALNEKLSATPAPAPSETTTSESEQPIAESEQPIQAPPTESESSTSDDN